MCSYLRYFGFILQTAGYLVNMIMTDTSYLGYSNVSGLQIYADMSVNDSASKCCLGWAAWSMDSKQHLHKLQQ